MIIEKIPVADRASWLALRERDVTASVAGALLGVHEFTTPYQLWALKSGLLSEDPEETQPQRRGRLLEPVAIQMIREDHPWLTDFETGFYYRDGAARLGATPDLLARCPRRGLGVIQIKTVENSVFARKWRDEETREVTPPLWIAVQAIVEAHLTGAAWAAVAALRVGYGVTLDLVEVPIHAGLIGRIREETARFWAWVENNEPPPADYERDFDTIAALNPVDPNAPLIDLSADNRLPGLIDERAAIAESKKADEARKKAIDAEITEKLAGRSVGLLADGRQIIRTIQHRGAFSVEATSFPIIRIKKPSSR